jgi:general secretion pathway protein K
MRSRRRQRGIALILALLVLAILILLVGQMTITSVHNRSVARNATSSLQNEYGVLAGYRQAMVRIEADGARTPDTDSLADVWNPPFSFELGNARVTGRITDAERKLNLSGLVNAEGEAQQAAIDMLARLLRVLGHEPVENAARIADYVDTDTQGPFEAGARNGPLFDLQELQRIEGLRREVLFGDGTRRGLLPFVTVWPKGAALNINPNTAPIEVLQALDDEITPELAQAIVENREGVDEEGNRRVFKNAQDLLNVAGMTQEILTRIQGHLVFRAGAFEVRITSTTFEVVRKELYIVGPPPGSNLEGVIPEMKLLASLREHEYFDLKPPGE